MTSLATGPGATHGPRERVAFAVAEAVDSLEGLRRSGGAGVEVATQYRGGKVVGVALAPEKITVCVIAEAPDVARLAADVHRAARLALDALGDARAVSVVVADLDLPGSPR